MEMHNIGVNNYSKIIKIIMIIIEYYKDYYYKWQLEKQKKTSSA